jgi:hypothetical protein
MTANQFSLATADAGQVLESGRQRVQTKAVVFVFPTYRRARLPSGASARNRSAISSLPAPYRAKTFRRTTELRQLERLTPSGHGPAGHPVDNLQDYVERFSYGTGVSVPL